MRSASDPLLRPIRIRLVAWSVLVILAVVAALDVAVYAALGAGLREEVDEDLERRAQAAAPGGVAALTGDARRADGEGYHGGAFVLVLSRSGAVLADPQRLEEEDLADIARLPTGFHDVRIDDDPGRVLVRDVSAGGQAARLVVGRDTEPEAEALGRLVGILFAAAAGGAALAFAGAWFLSGRALIPIAAAVRRQREFVADASHELRTPLTTLRASTELLARHADEPLAANLAVLDDMRHELRRTERLVDDLLVLARSDLGEITLAVGRVDLGRLADGIVRRLSPLAGERGVALSARGDGAVVDADPDRIEQALLVLVDNALAHTPRGGHVSVEVDGEGADAVVRVRDDGPGIPGDEIGHVFERFYRGDRSRARRGGAGLGLPIARALLRAHGGDVVLESASGAGTIATLRLPIRRVQHRFSIG